jgi:uncharacterized membrane protein YphA (DoxX/SURF4 family)
VTLIAPFAESLGCRALKDGLLCVFFLLALAALMTACIFATHWFGHWFADRGPHSQKQTTFSKGANR